jgi:hypothetical protein
VHCIEPRSLWRRLLSTALLLLGGCAPMRPTSERAPSTVVPVPTPQGPVQPTPMHPTPGDAAASKARRELPSPVAARTWDDFRKQAALRLVAATPDGSYIGEVVEPLLAIPVLEVELNGDGSVHSVTVLRHPRQARDTEQLAIDAVRRAAPFGDMRHLKKPWKFVEVFLFDDERRFKPRTLDAE